MNWLQIAGHLGADPEERFTSNDQKVTTLRLATHSRRGGKDETIWWKVTIWGDRFEKMMPYLKKGSPLIVYGEMSKPTIYTNKEGQPQISLEMTAEAIRFSPFGKGADNKGPAQSKPESNNFASQGAADPFASNDMDDEPPF